MFMFKINTFITPPLDRCSVLKFCTSMGLLNKNFGLTCVRLRAHIYYVGTDGNKIPLIILFCISSTQCTADHYTDSLYSVTVRVNCAFSLTKHCVMDICGRSEHYVAGEWPASRPGCFTLQGLSPYIGAWVGLTISVDVLAKRNVTALAGYRTRFCGLPSRS